VTLGDWLTGQKLTCREAAELCAKIADALHHAHKQGVVHRDLKPANVMIDGDGEPHLMDFGLARREVGEVTVTMDGHVLGTPAYMSPEQAEGKAHTADRRSDVYSLGVILFQLLTGELPFRGNARMLVHQVINDEPPSPRKLNSNVPKDLETITLKCLEKDPEKRFQSAESVAEELHRWLGGEPIRARPLGAVAKAWRWAKRKPAVAALLGLLLGSMLLGTWISAIFALQAEQERKTALAAAKTADNERQQAEKARESAEESRKNTEIQLQRNRLIQARLQIQTGDLASARLALLQPVDPSVEEEWGWTAWQYFRKNPEIERIDISGVLNLGHHLAPSRSGSRGQILDLEGQSVVILIPRGDSRYVIDLTTRQKLLDSDVPDLPFSPLHAQLAKDYSLKVIPEDKAKPNGPRNLVLEYKDGSVAWQQSEPSERIKSIAVHPNGRTVAMGLEDGRVQLLELSGPDDASVMRLVNTVRGSDEEIVSLMFHSSGDELFGLSGDWILRSWAWRPMPDTTVTPTGSNTVRRLRFSRSGKLLASGAYDGKVIVWDAQSHTPKIEFTAHNSRNLRFGSLEFYDNERQLLTSGPDESKVKFWDLTTGKMADSLSTASDTSRFVLAADGSTLFVGVRGTIDKWDLANKKRTTSVSPDGNENAYIYNIAYSDSQDRLFTVYTPESLASAEYKHRRCEVWDGSKMELVKFIMHDHEIGLRDVDLSPAGDLVGLCARDGAATIWDWKTGKRVHKLAVKSGAAHSNIVSAIRFSPRESFVVTASHDNQLIFWSLATGSELGRIQVNESSPISYGGVGALKECVFSPDGKTLAVTVGSDIWWMDLKYYDEQVKALRMERDELAKSGVALDLESVQATLNLIALKNRAARFSQTGRFRDAAILHRQVREGEPDIVQRWRDEAFAWVAAGDDEEYRRTCSEMIERFRGNPDPGLAVWVLYCCTRRPGSVADAAELLRLADIAAGRYPQYAAFGEFRCGRFREAAELLLVTEQWRRLERSELTVLAMAFHGLGQAERARATLCEARELHGRIQDDEKVVRETIEVLLNEAIAMIGENATEPQGDGIVPKGDDGNSLNLDFETGTLADWTIQGAAFAGQPVAVGASLAREDNLEIAPQGSYWIRAYGPADLSPVGEIRSAPFTVTHPWASFLLGGCAASTTRVEFVEHDTEQVIYGFEPAAPEMMRRVVFPMDAHMGKKVFIRLVNDKPNGHLHVSFDNFRFHAAAPGRPETLATKSANAPKLNWDVRFFRYQNKAWSDESAWKAAIAQEPFLKRSTLAINFGWGESGPSSEFINEFATVAVAKADVPAGDYFITTLADDGIRVAIDDRLVINNWNEHSPTTDIATVHLAAGEHTLRIEHFEGFQGAELRFRMIPAGSLGLGTSVKTEKR
jgi:WD40 repeat protein